MKAKVLELMKPKVKSFGFNDEELTTVCEAIANGLASKENVTDDDINAAIDAVLPALKISQSASNRSFERMKKQFEDDQKKKKEDEDEAAKKKAAEEEEAKKKQGDVPEWFKAYKEANDKQLSELKAENEAMKAEKANEGFHARAKKGLEKVDPNYYSLMLKGKKFQSDEEVDEFVKEVNGGWDALKKARNIQELAHVTPPGSKEVPTQPNDLVKARIEARAKAAENATNTVVKGLSK